MQSKLPVRIKKKPVFGEKKKCCCAKLLKIMTDKSIQNHEKFHGRKAISMENLLTNKNFKSRQIQTKMNESFTQCDNTPYTEIKGLLLSINGNLEKILIMLQDKKHYLYSKLHEEVCASSKKSQLSKNKVEKIRKKNYQLAKKFTYAWPEITRLYYSQQYMTKPYMQKLSYDMPTSNSSLVVYPSKQSCTTRPFSCSDLNYFYSGGKIWGRKPVGFSILNPIFSLIGQGDLEFKKNADPKILKTLKPALPSRQDVDD